MRSVGKNWKLIMQRGTRSLRTVIFALTCLTIFGWGWDSHRFINRVAVRHLPPEMMSFIQDSSYFSIHSVDADQRRVSGDTSFFAEGPRHFMDIDDYPNFHDLPRSLDSVIAMYGWERVKKNGTNPWATIWCYDSLVSQLSRGDWVKAKQTASDLGHYVGDAHQPLHNTLNYDGQLTSQRGIHARYESTMLSSSYYLSSLSVVSDSVRYIADRINFVFEYILHTNSLVDTVLQADLHAKSVSGWNGTGTNAPSSYYNALWEQTRSMTLDQMQRATTALASLWYSAWVDAGLIVTNVEIPNKTLPREFSLAQNFPNPFNPTTRFDFRVSSSGFVSIRVYDVLGREVATLVNEQKPPGHYTVLWDATNRSSGLYFYRMTAGSFVETKKMVLIR